MKVVLYSVYVCILRMYFKRQSCKYAKVLLWCFDVGNGGWSAWKLIKIKALKEFQLWRPTFYLSLFRVISMSKFCNCLPEDPFAILVVNEMLLPDL